MKAFKSDTGEEDECTVQSAHLEFTLKWVKLKLDQKSKVITVGTSGEKLACTVGTSEIKSALEFEGCSRVGETYVWPCLAGPYCPLHFLCTVKGVMISHTFTAKQNILAFDVTG